MQNEFPSNTNKFQPLFETTFEEYLLHQGASPITRKNYRADLGQFLGWTNEVIASTAPTALDSHQSFLRTISPELLERYKREQSINKTPVATINRRLSTVRAFMKCAGLQGWITQNPAEGLLNVKEGSTTSIPTTSTALRTPPEPTPSLSSINHAIPFIPTDTANIVIIPPIGPSQSAEIPLSSMTKEPLYKKLLHPYALVGLVIVILLFSTLLFSQIAGIQSGSQRDTKAQSTAIPTPINTSPPSASKSIVTSQQTGSVLGVTGATGPTEVSGPTGATGPSGEIGPTGESGSVGLSGLSGASGPTGSTGPTGGYGAGGSTGPTGPTGTNGPTGSTGGTGQIGANGEVVLTISNNLIYPYPVVDRSIALGSTVGGGQSTTATTSALILLDGTTGTASISSQLTIRGTSATIATTNNVMLTISGNIEAPKYFDSADQSYFLDPAATGTGLKLAGNIELTGGGSMSSTANNNITIDAGSGTVVIGSGTGKLDAGTVDPPYTINGKKYATYVPSMVGIKEELSGTVYTSVFVPGKGYRAPLDFLGQPEGSDLWLFSKVTALKKHIGQMTVLLSPATNTRSWYEVDPQAMRLTVYTSRPSMVSYRLSAPRFDAEEWANTRGQNESIGHLINDPDAPSSSASLDQSGYLADVSLTLTKENLTGEGVWTLKDAAGNVIQEVLTASQGTIANLTAGKIDVGDLSIGGKPISEYILDVIQNSKIVSPLADIDSLRTNVISPLSEEPGNGVAVKLEEGQTFGVYTKEGTPAASFDSAGNVHLQGDLSARQATFSGTLYADRIVTRFGAIGELQTSTVSATYITNITNTIVATDSGEPALPPVGVREILDLIARVRNGQTLSAIENPTLDATSSALLGLLDHDEPILVPSLLISGPLLIGNNGIQATSDTLYIEKGKMANLDIMNGTIVVNTTGDVMITGNLAVSGNVVVGGVLGVDRISPSQGELTIDLTKYGGTGTESGELVSRFGKLIFEREGREVAAITASGAGVFRKLYIDEASASGTLATPSAGLATLPAGAIQITIPNPHVTPESLIYVTPISSTANQVLYIYNKEARTSFTVAVDQALPQDIQFNWWIIN